MAAGDDVIIFVKDQDLAQRVYDVIMQVTSRVKDPR